MAFKKYQKTEQNKILSPEKHVQLGRLLQKTGKTSVADLTEEEKERVLSGLDK